MSSFFYIDNDMYDIFLEVIHCLKQLSLIYGTILLHCGTTLIAYRLCGSKAVKYNETLKS